MWKASRLWQGPVASEGPWCLACSGPAKAQEALRGLEGLPRPLISTVTSGWWERGAAGERAGPGALGHAQPVASPVGNWRSQPVEPAGV